MIKLLNRKFINHLFFWIILAYAIFIIDPSPTSPAIQIALVLLAVTNYAFIYYFSLYFILPKFYKSKFHLILICLTTFFFFVGFGFVIYDIFLYHYTGVRGFSEMPVITLIIHQLFLFFFILMPALGSYQSKVGVEKLKEKNKKEKDLKLKKLAFLRNQFNMNITFDFLNHCHDIIKKESVDTAKGINTFSKMLSYSLNNRISEKILIKNEIHYIENFIKIHKLLSNDTQVRLETTNCNKNIHIFPGILIGFVENAFKHGETYCIEHPIYINLTLSTDYIHFSVINKKNKQRKYETSGIGNYNLKQQLELLYKNKYILEIKDENEIYSANLKLKID